MNTIELAKDFTEMLKQHRHQEAGDKYNSDDIASYEAMEGPMAVCKGKAALQQKTEWWNANHEVHGGTAEGPYVNGDQFAIKFTMDVTIKESGQRMNMAEVGLYKVANGKIIEERFLYAQP